VKEIGPHSSSYTPRNATIVAFLGMYELACATLRSTVKVHCNIRLVDNIETIGHSHANIDWSSSDEDLD